jgi:predicted RNA-binding Zn-ribbon protein involved in translation (DUF1610 family)
MFGNGSAKHSSDWLHKQPAPNVGRDRDRRSDYIRGAKMRLESSGEFACPGCGAILHDSTLLTCTYCGSAFTETSGDITHRGWYTTDGGDIWTIVERKCPGCGSQVTDAAARQCPKCGHQPLPALDYVSDPRPTISIKINMPPISAGPGHIIKRTTPLVRYTDCRHWPVPPPVPKVIATLLRPLPDNCPNCNAAVFDVVMSKQQAWVVICAECDESPGVRADAD